MRKGPHRRRNGALAGISGVMAWVGSSLVTSPVNWWMILPLGIPVDARMSGVPSGRDDCRSDIGRKWGKELRHRGEHVGWQKQPRSEFAQVEGRHGERGGHWHFGGGGVLRGRPGSLEVRLDLVLDLFVERWGMLISVFMRRREGVAGSDGRCGALRKEGRLEMNERG